MYLFIGGLKCVWPLESSRERKADTSQARPRVRFPPPPPRPDPLAYAVLGASWAVSRIQISGSMWMCPLVANPTSSGCPGLILSEQGGQMGLH